MYVVLSGAKTNLGDFLITDRASALLRHLRPRHDLKIVPAWEKLAPDDDAVRGAAAIIIAGGPGYRPDMVPRVYPALADVVSLPCPVIPLGVGFKAAAADPYTVKGYRLSEETVRALSVMSSRGPGLGCRDRPTVDVLRRHGLAAARLVGCPVWYHIESLGSPMRLPSTVKRLVFTPAQQLDLADQSIELARGLAEIFPDAERLCSFHRGLHSSSAWIPKADIANNQRIASELAAFGYESVDVTGDLAKIAFYDESCLHVGYRVHAHIYFLSKRRPSLLMHEDGRGAGVSCTLDVQGVDAYAPLLAPRAAALIESRISHHARRFVSLVQKPSPFAVEGALNTMKHDLETGFARFAGVSQVIDAHFERMREFVSHFPD